LIATILLQVPPMFFSSSSLQKDINFNLNLLVLIPESP